MTDFAYPKRKKKKKQNKWKENEGRKKELSIYFNTALAPALSVSQLSHFDSFIFLFGNIT